MALFEKARVAEVFVSHGGRVEYGSGYRISTNLVLTVAHLTKIDRPFTCTVMLGGRDIEHPASLAWSADGRDLALLRLEPAAGTGADRTLDIVPPVALGRLPDGVGSVAFVGIGFPAYAQRAASERFQGLRRRDSREIRGFVQLGSNMKSGFLDLTITTAPPSARGPGGQDAWQGISGTALFTEDGSLLLGVQSHRLLSAGTGGAEAEPVAEALDSAEFRRELALDGMRPEAVAVDLPGRAGRSLLSPVVRQEELIEGFGDFKKNLTPERLPFVSPGPGHHADPLELFTRLVASADRGVLLVGAAGSGKTRTGLEVGRHALRAGWRVLHVLPGEDSSITDQITDHVLATPGPVLVVVDYLNEAQLDVRALRHQLIPAAHRRGIPMALLASVRPGWLQKADRALLHELFDQVELRQDEDFRRQVTENALRELAPKALRKLTKDRMMEICGNRPIVALLVAREIERRVEAGLSIPVTAGLRSSGELSGWLERRLSEDDFAVPGRTDSLVPARASNGLVAAAAAAAACPQPRAEVTSAARAALAEFSGESREAEHIVATLVSLGWLEPENDMLSVAHDVVADELVESVLLPERNTEADRPRSHAMLSGCLTNPRTIGRYAINIGRLVNDLSLADRAADVSSLLNDWFTEKATPIGDIMRQDANVGSYALGAVCSGAPWSTAAVRCWHEIFSPWLTEFGTDVNARHLLYRGLRHLPPDGALLLVPTALDWLKAHPRRRDATYVLSPLLHRTDVPSGVTEQAVRATLVWLHRNVTTHDAQFVLYALLSRSDLASGDAGRVVTFALAWLDRHASYPNARFILNTLLSNADLAPGDAERVVVSALTWLDHHAVGPNAGVVLRPLLSRADLAPGDVGRVVTSALVWLDHHATTADANYALRALLSRADLASGDAGRVVASALTWLNDHPAAPDADFILRVLLSRSDLASGDAGPVVMLALAWLDRHATIVDASYVLAPLLSRTDLAPGDVGRVVTLALTWLDDHPATADADFILRALLSRSDLASGDAGRVVMLALAWLDRHASYPNARYVLYTLLSRTDLAPGSVGQVVTSVLVWLDRHATTLDARFVLRVLLSRSDLASGDAGRVAASALTWLDHHATTVDASYVLAPLLSWSDLAPGDVRRVVVSALTWLDHHAGGANGGFVLRPLLSRADLEPGEAGRAVTSALVWLDRHATTPDARFVLRPLIFRSDLGPEDARQTAGLVLAWLDHHATDANAGFVLGPSLSRYALEPGDAGPVITSALAWLDRHAASVDARFVLRPLLSRSDLVHDEVRRLVTSVLIWLDRYSAGANARLILRPLLCRSDLVPGEVRRVVALALAWLDLHSTGANVRNVLHPLLSRSDLIPDEARQAVASALTWLHHQPAGANARFVLRPLLSRSDLTPEEARQADSFR